MPQKDKSKGSEKKINLVLIFIDPEGKIGLQQKKGKYAALSFPWSGQSDFLTAIAEFLQQKKINFQGQPKFLGEKAGKKFFYQVELPAEAKLEGEWKFSTLPEWQKETEEKLANDLALFFRQWTERQEAKQYKERYLRALADYDNLRKQMVQEKENWAKFAEEEFIRQLLPILNNFKLATLHLPEEQKKSPWVEGIFHIQRQLKQLLQEKGVEEIKTVGEKFDPHFHEAVEGEKKEKKGASRGIIVKEVIPGYIMKGKVIIPAKVIVE